MSRRHTLLAAAHRSNAPSGASYRYVRWSITERKGGAYGSNIQVSEFRVLSGGSPVAWPSGTTVAVTNATAGGGSEVPGSLIDGTVSTKSYIYSVTYPVLYDIDCGSGNSVTFDGYDWATANDSNDRDPYSWSVQGSNNGTTWTTLDTRTALYVTDTRQVYTGPYSPLVP